jgi:hypothetical protein
MAKKKSNEYERAEAQYNHSVLFNECERESSDFNLKSIFLDAKKVFSAYKNSLPRDTSVTFNEETFDIDVSIGKEKLNFKPYGSRIVASNYKDNPCGNYVYAGINNEYQTPVIDFQTTADEFIDDKMYGLLAGGDEKEYDKIVSARLALVEVVKKLANEIELKKQPKHSSLSDEFRNLLSGQKDLF